MRVSALLSAAAACLAPVTEAYIHTLGFPSTIQVGVPFKVYYEQLISQPRVHNLIFGIQKDDGNIYKGEIGSSLFYSGYIKDVLPGGSFNGTLDPQFTIPTYFESGPAVIKVLLTEFAGLTNGVGFRTIYVPVTIGDATSTERSFGSIDDENAESWVEAASS
ncbi:hypothetical protein KVR01_012168 [Diaporthe batatas]|uniref:uncharacterized protein n=1 Tax=Diaporthe batatas TaxID=748121 RepID=UPI001D049E37|nr:uncharacterized protein KVR01_012168 [Diaporthe batatas]KAG8157896.1 hypothetical protein KVR01_012168 [Diaporthe batatas]